MCAFVCVCVCLFCARLFLHMCLCVGNVCMFVFVFVGHVWVRCFFVYVRGCAFAYLCEYHACGKGDVCISMQCV